MHRHARLDLRGGGTAHSELLVTRYVVLIVSVVMLELIVFGVLDNVSRRTSEQALVCLSPAAPSGSRMNRVLARYFLTRFATTWCAFSAMTLGALLVLGSSPGEALRAAVVFIFSLVLGAVLLADYSRRDRNKLWARLYQLAFSSIVVTVAIAAIRGSGSAEEWAEAVPASLALAVLLGYVRWRRMVAAPAAFPAGRFN